MKKIFFSVLAALCFFPMITLAAGKDTDSYIECWYRNSDIYFYYNATTNEFTFQGKRIDKHSWTSDLIKSNFIDKKTNTLKCPNIYTTTGATSGMSANTHVHIKKTSNSDVYHEPNKSNSKNAKLTTTKTCVYSSGKFKIEFILDTSKKSIVSSKVNGQDANSNEFKYSEIFKDNKCVDIKKIYGSCYDGGRGGSSVCNITKQKPTGHSNTDNTELDYEDSTGAEDPDIGNDQQLGELQKGCEVIPEVVRKWINNILKFIRYVALALVIALGALDFMKAAGDGEADAMKKAGQSFMKRMIAVVILFLLPVIVDFILNMVNIYGVDPNNIDCLKPTK